MGKYNNISLFQGKGNVVFVSVENETGKNLFINLAIVFFGIPEEGVIPTNDDIFFFEKGGNPCAALHWFGLQNGVFNIEIPSKIEEFISYINTALHMNTSEPSY